MLFLRSWLDEYIDLSAYSNKQIADVLTRKSAEVEEVLSIRDYFNAKVLVGQVKNLRRHPDADRLQVFDVDLGSRGHVQIVSAAANVKEGLIVPVALEGAKLAGLTIVPRKMRGIESQGMCCGMSELMLETPFSAGLWELNDILSRHGIAESFVGQSICEALPEYFPEETVMDIKVLPDKISVIGSHLGMALELAVCLQNQELLKPKAKLALDPQAFWDKAQSAWNRLSVSSTHGSMHDPHGYARAFFMFRLKLAGEYHLPHEWRKRMYLTGRNQIGGLADLSNYLLADVGQPTHFFSSAKLLALQSEQNPDNTELQLDLRIKKLEDPQPFEGLGQLKSVVTPSGVEIMEDKQGNFLTIPGISGGNSTKVEESETDIVVEIANFPGERVARSSFALNYRSEGSKIWAGEVRPALIPLTLYWLLDALPEAHAEILLSYVADDRLDLADWQNSLLTLLDDKPVITLDLEYLSSRLDGRGRSYWEPVILDKLSLLGQIKDNLLLPNQFYSRLERQEDVLAEIVRLVGFEALQDQDLSIGSRRAEDSGFAVLEEVKNLASAYGLNEIITRPFVSQDKLLQSWLGSEKKTAYKVLNPYNSLEPNLRDSLLPSLLKAGSENVLSGQKVFLYEVNKVYSIGPSSRQLLGVLSETPDPYQLTSLLQELARRCGLKVVSFSPLFAEWSAVGNGVVYELESGVKAVLVELKNSLKKDFNIPLQRKLWYLELDLSSFRGNWNHYPEYVDESDYPSIRRTYSYKVPQNVIWAEVERILQTCSLTGANLLINPLERRGLDADADALNFEVEFRSYQRTLQSEEVAEWERQVLLELGKLGRVELR